MRFSDILKTFFITWRREEGQQDGLAATTCGYVLHTTRKVRTASCKPYPVFHKMKKCSRSWCFRIFVLFFVELIPSLYLTQAPWILHTLNYGLVFHSAVQRAHVFKRNYNRRSRAFQLSFFSKFAQRTLFTTTCSMLLRSQGLLLTQHSTAGTWTNSGFNLRLIVWWWLCVVYLHRLVSFLLNSNFFWVISLCS